MKKPPRTEEYKAFLLHKRGATIDRGIAFHFTYEGWVAWWKHHLGPHWLKQRGCKQGQYCMARYGDEGPYAAWNVKCILHSENSREQNRHGAKLTRAEVTIIYRTTYQRGNNNTSKAALARRFNVSKYTIKDIKKKVTWRSVTDLLD